MDPTVLLLSLLMMGVVTVLFVHELGHLLVARYYGFTVLSLSVGIGPPLLSLTDRHGTSWKLRAFPLGASCTYDEIKTPTVKSQPNNKSFSPYFRERALIHAAGPIANLILAAAYGLLASTLCTTCTLYGGQTSSIGLMTVRLSAELSFATALFNLLPFLPLDGGQLCVAAVEARLGRPISPTNRKRFFVLSIIFLVGLSLAYLVLGYLSLLQYGTISVSARDLAIKTGGAYC